MTDARASQCTIAARVGRVAAIVLLLVIACARCANEDGEPDPPVRGLVPCNPDAGSGDPEACPPRDAGIDARMVDG
jgi:hypothetical protein